MTFRLKDISPKTDILPNSRNFQFKKNLVVFFNCWTLIECSQTEHPIYWYHLQGVSGISDEFINTWCVSRRRALVDLGRGGGSSWQMAIAYRVNMVFSDIFLNDRKYYTHPVDDVLVSGRPDAFLWRRVLVDMQIILSPVHAVQVSIPCLFLRRWVLVVLDVILTSGLRLHGMYSIFDHFNQYLFHTFMDEISCI